MQISDFTLRIILLFIPGIISFFIIDKLTVHKEFRIHQILINSFIIGFFCYSLYYFIIHVVEFCLSINLEISFFEALIDRSVKLNFTEITFVAGLSVIIGFLFAFLINRRVLYVFSNKLRITNKFGKIDVWSYIMNSDILPWVVIRDKEHDLMYEGYIRIFSDSSEKDELFLCDVKVYKNSTAEELYEIPGLYLPAKRENLVVEFPLLEFSKYKERPK